MKGLAAFFLLELNRFFRKRNIIIMLLFWGLLGLMVIDGVYEYKSVMLRVSEFQEVEKLSFLKYPDYDVYGDEGITVQYCPGPLGIFFKDIGISPNLVGKFDSIVNLSIFDNYKSKSLLKNFLSGTWSFAGIILICGSLIALFWGTELLNDKEYMRFLASFISPVKACVFSNLSRMLLLTLILSAIFLSMYGLLMIFGISLSVAAQINFIYYFGTTVESLCFFLLAGGLIGLIRAKKGHVLLVIAIWFLFIFVGPGFIQKYVESNTFGSIEDYKTEIKKMKIVSDFEKVAATQNGKFNRENIEGARRIIEKYVNEYYPRIESIENNLMQRIHRNIESLDALSALTPVSFLYLTSIEISTHGYRNFLDFYGALVKRKKDFVRFWLDRVFYNDPRVMVNFVRDDENLFFAQSRLPGKFLLGLLINFFYVTVLFCCSFWLYKRSLISLLYIEKSKDNIISNIKLEKGKLKVWEVHDEFFKSYIYSSFSGNISKLTNRIHFGKVILDDVELSTIKKTYQIYYICHSDNLPGDIKIRDFIIFVLRLNRMNREGKNQTLENLSISIPLDQRYQYLTAEQKGKVQLTLLNLKRSEIYLFNDTARGMSIDFHIQLKEKMEFLSARGSFVLYLTTNDLVIERVTATGSSESPNWTKMVEHFKRIKLQSKNYEKRLSNLG